MVHFGYIHNVNMIIKFVAFQAFYACGMNGGVTVKIIKNSIKLQLLFLLQRKKCALKNVDCRIQFNIVNFDNR